MATDNDTAYTNFRALVNMAPKQLETWLQTPESRSVGIRKGTTNTKVTSPKDGESIGHESGRIIVELLHMKKADLDDQDYKHMRKVVGYIKRHLARKPTKSDIATSRWRYSLMNWGHDPLKQPRT